ncbi:MAG: hypothetical protein AB7O52_05700 [Planctomycetota bacterium]
MGSGSGYGRNSSAFLGGDRLVLFPWGTLKMVHRFGCRGPDPNPTLGALAI